MKPPNQPTTPPSSSFSSAVNDFALEPQVEVKTEIKVEPDFYPPMDHADYSPYDNDYATPDYSTGSNQNLPFLQDYQDNASNSTNSSYSFNNNDAAQEDEGICCVPKCGVSKLSSPTLQFFSFPKDEKYLSQWLHNLKMTYDPNTNYSMYRICSLHFPKRCIAKYSLSYWAVPTFNLGHDDVGNLYQNRESSGGFPGGEMAKCSMPGCPSQRGETNVKFHVFPRDLKTLIKWCQNSRLPVHSKDNRFFCSRHFEEKCFGKFRLKPWAIPTLNLGTVYGKIHDNPNIYQEEKKCFLPYCRRSRSYDCNLSLYRFPRDETLLRRWCYNLRLDPNMYRGKNHKICSSHFIKEALGLRKLNPGAVPTLNLGHNDRFNIYENELYTPPPPPPPPQPSTSSKAHKFAEMFKQEMGSSSRSSRLYDGVFMSSVTHKFSNSSSSNSSNTLDLGDVCLVPSCKRTRHSDDITLHTIPKREEQLKKWCHNLKMDLRKMHKSVRICSAHFEKYCIGGCMRPFAVPTLELGHDDLNIYRNPDVIKKLNIRETCCVASCKRNRDRDHANLHRFPTHPELLQKWCDNLQKPVPDGTKLFNDAVCEVHFEERCLKNKRLEKWAIPTLNLGWDGAPHHLPSEEEINDYWVKPFAPNNGEEQGECCVASCKRNPQIDDVKLYRPPEDAEQLVKWAHNLQVDANDLPNLKICNLHFEQHCIGKRLLNWAMPTLNLGGKVEHLFENPPPMPNIYKRKEKPARILSSHEGIKWSPRCCLSHCRKMRSVHNVHLFRFPYSNRQTLAKWCHNLQLPLVGSSHRRICSTHFEPSVLTKRCPMTLAVPTLDLNTPPGYKIYQNPARLKQIKLGSQRQCVIESCRKTKLDGVSLFRFPNNRSMLYKWRHNIKHWPKGKLTSTFRICTEHFEPHSVGERRLSPGAIPTLKLGHDSTDLYPNETRSFFDLEKCVVSGCDSRKEMEDVRLFRFPRDDDDVLRKWCNNLKMNANDCVGIKICNKHFEDECLGPRLLYKWAVPTLKLGHKEDELVEIIQNPPPEQRTGEFLYKCCVPTCGKSRKYDDAQMNSFPKHLKMFRKWKHNLKLDFLNFKEREKYKICNDHFEPVCVGKTRLNFGALPTLNLGHDDVDDLYQINPDRIRPNLFIRQKDVERLERKRLRETTKEQYECDNPEDDDDDNDDGDENAVDPLSLESSDIKCCVTDCTAPKSIMREPYELPESLEFRQLWFKEYQKSDDEEQPIETKICGLHFQIYFQQLKTKMLSMLEEGNEVLQTDFNNLQYNYQKSTISLVVNSYQCRVEGCTSNLLNPNIRLYFFPYGKNLVSKWSHNTGIIPDEHRRYMNKVCALHFESYCVTENQRLRSWAIPTLNLPDSENKRVYKNPDLTKLDKRMLGPQIPKCAVANCNSDKTSDDESIKLFNFPTDENLLKKWCDNLKMSHRLTPLQKICSLHFEKSCLGSCRIRSWAIPTLNLGHDETPEHPNKKSTSRENCDASEDTTEIQLKQVKIKRPLDSTKCCIASCRKSRLKHGVRLYCLPSNSKMKRKWMHNLKINHLKNNPKLHSIKVCNHHFHKRCWDGKNLKPWAVPTLHLGHSEAIFDNPRRIQAVPIVRCALSSCKNYKAIKDVQAFVFPKSPELLEKWSKNLKLDLEQCTGNICYEHFEKEVLAEKKLKANAVPTLNLGHEDIIFDNTELIDKLQRKQTELLNAKKRRYEDDVDYMDVEYEDRVEEEEEEDDMWEYEEYNEDLEDEEEDEDDEYEECYYDDGEDDDEDDEVEEEEDDEDEEFEDNDDEHSISNSITDWSGIKFKELRVSLTPLTPEDLMDLCSRSSYEREFGSITSASSLRGRRSITPAASLKDLRSETPEQNSRSETPNQKQYNCFREPLTIAAADQIKADNLREPSALTPEQKTDSRDSLNDYSIDAIMHNETSVGKPNNSTEISKAMKFPMPENSEILVTSNNSKTPALETCNENAKQERYADENTTSSDHNDLEHNASTNLRTDKPLNPISPRCCLKHCGKEKTPEQHLTTYGFPKDPQLLRKWCDNLGLQPEECIGRVCIDHFELRVVGVRRLKLGAVPTLNLGPNRIAKHTNSEETPQKKAIIKEFTETGNMQETDNSSKPLPPYKTTKPGKQSVFRLCCLKHCRRKKFIKPNKKTKRPDLNQTLMECQKNAAVAPNTLFKFPADTKILKKWCKNLRLPEKLCLPSDLEICARHFEANAIQDGKLHPKAIPTLELSYANRAPIYKNNPKDFEQLPQKAKQETKEKCFLEHCGKTDDDNTFLISFPLNEPRTLRRWCKNLKIDCDKNKLKTLKICNEHFETYVFFKKKHLRVGGLPTLNLGHNGAIVRNCRKLRLKKTNGGAVKEKCCVQECQETNLKLFSFPRSSDLRKIWCNNLQLDVRQVLINHLKVCARHFNIECFTVGTDNLKLNAVPMLHLGLQSESHMVMEIMPSERKCMVENCQKTPSVDRVKLFNFPQKKDILKKWLFNLNLSPDTYNPNAFICSRHFDKSCIKNGMLHENSIPTHFLQITPKGWFYKNNEELYEMPKKCCVLNCGQTSEEAKHLYRFPKHKEDLEKWLYNLKLQVDENDVKDLRVCDRHFEQNCKISNKDLITQSLPTLNLGHTDTDIYGNNFIKCCLNTCNIEGFYFHKLPEDLMLQSYWFQELEMESTYNSSLYICSVHFVAFFERILEKYSAFLKESKEYVKLALTYNELKALPALQCYKCFIPKCNSGFKLIWKLFKFPKDETLFNKWLHNTGLQIEHSQRPCYRICAQHFEERCLSEKKLHRWSLPTLKLPFNNSLYVNPPEALPSNHENLKHCCVSNCLNEKGPFFKFPVKQLEVKKWIHNLDLGTQQCTLNLRVCYKHFENYCFSKINNKIRSLKSWSVPTLKLKRKSELYLNPADKIAFYVCCINSCRQTLNKTKQIFLYKFPQSNTLRQKWLHNLNLTPHQYKETMRICSIHFEMDCFYKDFKLMRKHSVPTLALATNVKELYRNPVRRPYLKCCVKLCKGPWENLINFPKHKTLLRKWCHNLNFNKDITLESLREYKICEKHFEKLCFNRNNVIRPTAMPTLKLGHNRKLFLNPDFTRSPVTGTTTKKLIKVDEGDLEKSKELQQPVKEEKLKTNLKKEKDEKKEKVEKAEKEMELKTLSHRKLNPAKKTIKRESMPQKLGRQKKLIKTKILTKKSQLTKSITLHSICNETKNDEAKRINESIQEQLIVPTLQVNIKQEINNEQPQQMEKEHIETKNINVPPPQQTKIKHLPTTGNEDDYLESLLEILTETSELEGNQNVKTPTTKPEPLEETNLNIIPSNKTEKENSAVNNDNKSSSPPLDHSKSNEENNMLNIITEANIVKAPKAIQNLNSCCVKTCPNYNNYNASVALFKIPKINGLRHHWIANCQLKSGILKPVKVCIEHFESHCLKDNNRLLFGAVPTVNLGVKLDSKEILKTFSYSRCRIESCQRSIYYDKINRIPFPKGLMKTKWCCLLNLNEDEISNKDWICHRHFEKGALIDCRKLKPGTQPTLLLDIKTKNATTNDVLTTKAKKCCVRSCNSSSLEHKLFPLPITNEDTCKKWLHNLNLLDNCSASERKQYYVCEQHFEGHCFHRIGGRLKFAALPTLRLDRKKNLYLLSDKELRITPTLKDTKLKCCFSNCHKDGSLQLYDWPYKDICKDILLQQQQQNDDGNSVNNKKDTDCIRLCDEHFYKLYKPNQQAINDSHLDIKVKNSLNLVYEDLCKQMKFYTRKCMVPECPTDYSLKEDYKSLKLFSFPKTDASKKWCHNIGIDFNSLKSKPNQKVCELHFEPYCLARRMLFNWSIPTLNLPAAQTETNHKIIQNDADDIFAHSGQCCIKGCVNEMGLDCKTKTRFYRFPTKTDILEHWLQLSKCKDFNLNVTRICGLHFHATDFLNKKTTLKEDAVPSINLSTELNNSPANSIIDENIQVKQELDNSEEWCEQGNEEDINFSYGSTALKSFALDSSFETKLKEDFKTQDYNALLDIKEEIIEIEEDNNIMYEINKFEEANEFEYETNFDNMVYPNEEAGFVISDVKSQIYLCCVQKCSNSSETPNIKIYTEFPTDSEIFIKWCFNLKIDPRNYKENQYAICQKHFESICFTDSLTLYPWAVPTLNLNLNENSFIHKNDVPDYLKPCTEQCIVYGCINHIKPLYKFPQEVEITQKWFTNLKLDYTDFRAQNYRICRRHFSQQCFVEATTDKLKTEALPTLYLGHSDKIVYLNNRDEQQQLDHDDIGAAAGLAAGGVNQGGGGIAGGLVVANNQDNSRGSSQGSLARIISPHDLEDHDSSYYEDFEEYYGQDD